MTDQNTPITYRDLRVWQRGMDVVTMTYAMARRLPPDQKYVLTSQMQRAAISIPLNIAEGYGRCHLGDYRRHISIANGSLLELETCVLIALRLGYVSEEDAAGVKSMLVELGRMLAVLARRLTVKARNKALTPDP